MSEVIMTSLIQPNDPRYFTQTSDGLYDRHCYRVHVKDSSYDFNDYDELRSIWFEHFRNWKGVTIEVMDIPKKNIKGFGI